MTGKITYSEWEDLDDEEQLEHVRALEESCSTRKALLEEAQQDRVSAETVRDAAQAERDRWEERHRELFALYDLVRNQRRGWIDERDRMHARAVKAEEERDAALQSAAEALDKCEATQRIATEALNQRDAASARAEALRTSLLKQAQMRISDRDELVEQMSELKNQLDASEERNAQYISRLTDLDAELSKLRASTLHLSPGVDALLKGKPLESPAIDFEWNEAKYLDFMRKQAQGLDIPGTDFAAAYAWLKGQQA